MLDACPRGSALRSELFDGGPSSEALGEQQLMEKSKRDGKAQEQNLVSGLSSGLENDADLKIIMECWLELPDELKQAIVRMIS